MNAYADTGLICSLYAPDAHTALAAARMQQQELPISFIWLHQLEFRNAMRLRVFRKEITPAQRDASINAWLADIMNGVFRHRDVPQPDLLIEAERLSAGHTDVLGARSLDILHVAAALVLGTSEFLSFDRRQSDLARAVGLNVPDLLPSPPPGLTQ